MRLDFHENFRLDSRVVFDLRTAGLGARVPRVPLARAAHSPSFPRLLTRSLLTRSLIACVVVAHFSCRHRQYGDGFQLPPPPIRLGPARRQKR